MFNFFFLVNGADQESIIIFKTARKEVWPEERYRCWLNLLCSSLMIQWGVCYRFDTIMKFSLGNQGKTTSDYFFTKFWENLYSFCWVFGLKIEKLIWFANLDSSRLRIN